MNRKHTLVFATAAIFICLCAGATSPSFKYERGVTVVNGGWARVRLPAEVLLKLSPAENDLRLFDAKGKAVPFEMWTGKTEPPATAHEARVYNIETVPGGWMVEADLGEGAPRHRRTIVNLPGTGIAENVFVEGSNDGNNWRLLAKGAFFRLTPGSRVEKTWLNYEPVRLRRLRIFWPSRAGIPRWQSIVVEDWPDDVVFRVEDPVPSSLERSSKAEASYLLTLPAFHLKDALLALRAKLTAPVRLTVLKAQNGYWKVVSEAVLGPDRDNAIYLAGRPLVGKVKVVVDSGVYPLPEIEGFSLRYPPRDLVFKAVQPGVFTLKYGKAPGWAFSPSIPGSLAVPDRIDNLAILGKEKTLPLPDLPAKSLGLGGVLPDCSFARRWTVEGGGIKAGKLVSIEVPPEAYAVARKNLGDLRLAVRGRQAPYILNVPPDGREVLRLNDLKPSIGEKKGTSVINFSVKNPLIPLTALTLVVPSAPFSREIVLQDEIPMKDRDGRKKLRWTRIRTASWKCPGVSELPARLTLPLYATNATRFRIVFYDGDNAPLSPVDLTLWSRRHLLIFPWPGDGNVSLLAGAARLSPPVYDLASLKGQLLNRDFVVLKTSVAPPKQIAGDGNPGGWFTRSKAKIFFIILLCLVCVVLFAIVVRTIKETPSPKSD